MDVIPVVLPEDIEKEKFIIESKLTLEMEQFLIQIFSMEKQLKRQKMLWLRECQEMKLVGHLRSKEITYRLRDWGVSRQR